MSEILNPYPHVTIGSEGSLVPHSLYKTGEPLLTRHLLKTPVQTKAFLLGYPDKDILDNTFDTEGKLIYQSSINPYLLHGQGIIKGLGKVLKPWYELVQQSYLRGHDGDFNNHLVGHVTRVGTVGVHILKNCDPNVSRKVIDNTLITGMLHDIAGINDRREHANIAPHLAQDLIPALATDPNRFLDITTAIVQHDEGYFRKLKGYSHEPFEKRSRTLQVTQTRSSAATLIADKSDVGRERVHKNSRTKNSMNGHIHSEVNMFTGDLLIDVSDEALTWTVAFNPFIDETERKANSDLILGKRDDEYYYAYGSPRVRVDPNDPYKGISYDKVWNELCHIYGPQQVGEANRLQIMVDSGLTHFRPNFNIVYYNPFNDNEFMVHQLNAQNVDAYFEQMALNNIELNKNTQEQKAMGVI